MVYAKEEGFTLVEVLISLLIFLIVSMGLLPLLWKNIETGREVSLHDKARELAGSVMAEMQAVDYDSLEVLASLPGQVGLFTVVRDVMRDFPQRGQSSITVTTRWQSKGHVHSYQLQSIRTSL